MDAEDVMVWKIVMVAICTAVALIGGCNGTINYQDNAAMVEMVANGADPQDARCAVKGEQQSATCGIRAATKNK